ncbi:hypothetical protein [Streptomyces olivaceoviridis]|uniref:hypothetical protein n=1 Tax=Streptomyces olivaceoviridis TaxID=1921 RepID=UPI0036BC9D03
MKKTWSMVVAGGALAVSILGTQQVASAATVRAITVKAHPSDCHYEKFNPDGQQGATASCKKSNGGHYKAIVVCVRELNGDRVEREAGFWQSGGKVSYVWCPPESFSETAGILTKAS